MPSKPTADYSFFASLDIRVGQVVKVENAATKKPTYQLTVDYSVEQFYRIVPATKKP